MSNNISIYKTINNSLYRELEISHTDMYFSYTEKDGDEIQIVMESQEDLHSFYMGKTNSFWDADINDLNIERTFIIGNPKVMFSKRGVTTEEGILGIGAHIYSRTSNFQTTIPLEQVITKDTENISVKFTHTFDKGEIKGDIYFSIFIYLTNPIKKVNMFAEIPGIRLGEIDSFKITADGDGSVFPIVEVERPGQPLWNLVADWTDINNDIFDINNIRIEINSSHHMYNYIYSGTKPSQYLLVEVLSNAIAQIIFKAVEDEDFEEESDLIPDSILSVVLYWIKTFEVDIHSFETISYSLRRNIEPLFIS